MPTNEINREKAFFPQRVKLLILLLIVFTLGLFSKLQMGKYSEIWPDKIAGAFYVLFWCLFFKTLFIHKSTWKTVMIVLLVTCLLEFTQLFSWTILNLIRSNFVGRSLIGSSFSWSDFPWYMIGACMAYMLIRSITGKLN
jgi:hypothetical protein